MVYNFLHINLSLLTPIRDSAGHRLLLSFSPFLDISQHLSQLELIISILTHHEYFFAYFFALDRVW